MTTNADRDLGSHVPDQSAKDDGPAAAVQPGITVLHTGLEHALIDAYLASRGHTLRSIDELPPAEREPLLRAATASATLKLAEIEARAHLLDQLG
jgi:hypothetical protein